MDAAEKVQPTDLLVIEIRGEPDLPVNYTVRADGTIRLPFLGSITVEGQTAAQVRESIGKVLSDRKLGSVSQVTVTHRR
jgi:protein involved in polysaccharide export with SLBB domain